MANRQRGRTLLFESRETTRVVVGNLAKNVLPRRTNANEYVQTSVTSRTSLRTNIVTLTSLIIVTRCRTRVQQRGQPRYEVTAEQK